MQGIDNWAAAFPIRPATERVDAILESWQELAKTPRPHFNRQTREPQLTRALKTHVERVTARRKGLLGMWAAESVQNRMNLHTGELVEERRTDIVYGWNSEDAAIQLVFEFKKLNRYASSRTKYLGNDGLGRFVSGIYAERQPIAVMVGILISEKVTVVPPLKNSLGQAKMIASLNIVCDTRGHAVRQPSQLFSAAEFDTKHYRIAESPLENDKIQIAHMFLSFGY